MHGRSGLKYKKVYLASARSARTVMERGKGELYLVTSQDIQQRASMLLRDVRYVIDAHFDMTDQASASDIDGKFHIVADAFRLQLRPGEAGIASPDL